MYHRSGGVVNSFWPDSLVANSRVFDKDNRIVRTFFAGTNSSTTLSGYERRFGREIAIKVLSKSLAHDRQFHRLPCLSKMNCPTSSKNWKTRCSGFIGQLDIIMLRISCKMRHMDDSVMRRVIGYVYVLIAFITLVSIPQLLAELSYLRQPGR